MQGKIEDSGFCPSFSCYSSDSLAAMAAARVSCEEEGSRHIKFSDFDDDEFEFSLVEEVSAEDIASEGRMLFPVFNRDLIGEDTDRQVKGGKDGDVDDGDASSEISIPLQKLFFEDREEPSSSSSSEVDELESIPSGTYCVWRPRVPPSPLTKCKKSSSTGSGSKRWRIRDLLKRSNSEGKEPMVFLTPKKVEASKQKRNSGEASKVDFGKLKASSSSSPSPSVHELFYVQKRAQKEEGKRKSYLPYRRDLVGFFANVNGIGKKLPF